MVHDRQQIVVGLVDGPADAGILVEGVLDGRFDVAENDDGRFHVDCINRRLFRRRNVDEPLAAQCVDDGLLAAGRIDGMVDGVGVVAGNKLCQDFRNDDLADIGNACHVVGIEKTDAGNASVSGIADVRGNGRVVELAQQIAGAHAVDGGVSDHLALLAGVVDVQRPDVVLFDVAVDGLRMVAFIPEGAADGPQAFGAARLERADADFPGFQDVLVRRFAQVKVVVVNEVLGHGVDEVGNIPVEVDVLAYFRRADVFVELVQRQADDLGLDAVGLFMLVRFGIFPRLPGEGDMVDRMDRVRRRYSPVSRRIFDDVRADGDVQVPAGKDILELLDVRRIGDVDGDIVREGIHVLFIGDGHVHDFAAHEPRLGVLGPGKFIEGQVNVETQVAYLAGHGLVAQAEGVEGPRIEAGLAACFKGKGPSGEFVLADVAVNMVEHGRIAVEIQIFFAVLIEEDQEFLIAVAEEEIFPFIRHERAVEDEFP